MPTEDWSAALDTKQMVADLDAKKGVAIPSSTCHTLPMINLTDAELANFVWTAKTPADGLVVNTTMVYGGSLNVGMSIKFETTEDRDVFLASVPKSFRFKLNSPTDVRVDLDFRADERTGSVNETAAKRLRSILKKMDQLGIPVTHQVTRVRNDQPNIEEVLAMIDAPIAVSPFGGWAAK